MKKKKKQLTLKNGFTLIELLIVIAIIGILAGVVMVSTQGATLKAKKASAISTVSSALPELVTCSDDNGFALTVVTTGGKICCTNANCAANTFVAGHNATWPDISKTGWDYDTANTTGAVVDGDYVFKIKLVSDNTKVITCSMSGDGCTEN